MNGTVITINISAGYLILGIGSFFLGLLAIVWKGKQEIANTIDIKLEPLKHNVKVICDFFLKQYNPQFDPKEIKSYSPSSLTPEGEKLISDLGFDNVFKDHKDDFFNFIKEENPKLKYDVEAAAIKSIFLLSDKSYMDFLKVFFYNNPKRLMENTAPTLGIYIRDKYLAEHPEITQ